MAKNLPDVSQKVVADAQQYINEFIRASKAQKSTSAEMSAEADKLVSGLKKKFGAADIGKEFLKGMGLGSGMAVAEKVAELAVMHWEKAAENARIVAEQTEAQLATTREIISLRQNEEQRLATARKQLRDATQDRQDAQRGDIPTGLLAIPSAPGAMNPFAVVDSLLKWVGVIDDGATKVARLTTEEGKLSLAVAKAKEALDAQSAAADNADFKQMQADLAAIAKEQAAWAKSQQAQADQADAIAAASAAADAAHEARLDSEAEKWLHVADPMLQYQRDLAEIIRLQEAGKLTADEAAAAMQALMEKNGQSDPAGTGRTQIFDDYDQARETALRKTKEWAEITKSVVNDVGDGLTYALVDSLNGVGDAFSNLKDIIIREIEMIVVKMMVVAPIMHAIGAMLGGGTLGTAFSDYGVSAHAAGGDFAAGETMLVGEQGPEIVRFGSGGTVIPNHKIGAMASAGSGGGDTYVYSPQIAAGVTRQDLAGMMPKMFEQWSAQIADKVMRGGGYRQAFA